MTYPDVELALCDLLEFIAPTVTQLTPAIDSAGNIDLAYFPRIRIARIAGGDADDDLVSDDPRVQISYYAVPTPAQPRASHDLAKQGEDFLHDIRGAFAAGTLIDFAAKDSGPVSRPWDDPRIRVTEQVWSLTVRN